MLLVMEKLQVVLILFPLFGPIYLFIFSNVSFPSDSHLSYCLAVQRENNNYSFVNFFFLALLMGLPFSF